MLFALLSVCAGAAIALQASMNAQLGSLLNNPILATVCAFFFSASYSLIALATMGKSLPNSQMIASVPWYLWGLGGVLSAVGVGLCYFLIPKMGIGSLMSFVLSGQILMAMLIAHFGWFNVPQVSISTQKVFGILALVAGIVLINKDFQSILK